MLTKENFGIEHINGLRENSRCDPAILERSIYAFGLLESLVRVNMPFIFKENETGGLWLSGRGCQAARSMIFWQLSGFIL